MGQWTGGRDWHLQRQHSSMGKHSESRAGSLLWPAQGRAESESTLTNSQGSKETFIWRNRLKPVAGAPTQDSRGQEASLVLVSKRRDMSLLWNGQVKNPDLASRSCQWTRLNGSWRPCEVPCSRSREPCRAYVTHSALCRWQLPSDGTWDTAT